MSDLSLSSNFFEKSSIAEVDTHMTMLYAEYKNNSLDFERIKQLFIDANSFFTVNNYFTNSDTSMKFRSFIYFLTDLHNDIPTWVGFSDMYIPLINASSESDDILFSALCLEKISHSEILPYIENIDIFGRYVSTLCEYLPEHVNTLFKATTFRMLPYAYKTWIANYACDSIYKINLPNQITGDYPFYALPDEITDDYPFYVNIFKSALSSYPDLMSINSDTPELKFKLIALHMLLDKDPGWSQFFDEDVHNDYGFIKDSMHVLCQELMTNTFKTKLAIADSLSLADNYIYWQGSCMEVLPMNATEMPIFE